MKTIHVRRWAIALLLIFTFAMLVVVFAKLFHLSLALVGGITGGFGGIIIYVVSMRNKAPHRHQELVAIKPSSFVKALLFFCVCLLGLFFLLGGGAKNFIDSVWPDPPGQNVQPTQATVGATQATATAARATATAAQAGQQSGLPDIAPSSDQLLVDHSSPTSSSPAQP